MLVQYEYLCIILTLEVVVEKIREYFTHELHQWYVCVYVGVTDIRLEYNGWWENVNICKNDDDTSLSKGPMLRNYVSLFSMALLGSEVYLYHINGLC